MCVTNCEWRHVLPHHWPDVVVPLQAIELGDWLRATATALTDVPHLHAALATGINILGWIRDCHGADHLAVSERVYLTRMTRYARANKCVLRKWHRLHLTFARHVKTVRTAMKKKDFSHKNCDKYILIRWCKIRSKTNSELLKRRNTHGLPPGGTPSGPSGALMLAWGS